MGLDLSSADAVIKEFYDGPVRDELNHKTVLMHRLERNTQDFEGTNCVIPLNTGRNEGIGARAEHGILPAAGRQAYHRAVFGMRYNYGSIELTGPTLAAMRSDSGSFIRALDSEVKGCVRDLSNDMNRQLFGDGTGILADPAGTSAGVTQTLDSVKHIRVGMKVDFVETNNGNISYFNVEVTAINSSNLAVTFDQSVTPTANTRITRHGSYGKEVFGLAAVVSDANPTSVAGAPVLYGNIDRSTNVFWQANILANGGTPRNLNLDLMQEATDEVDLQGDGNTTLIITDFIQYRKYANLLLPDKRFPTANGQTIDLDGGFKALTYNGIPVVRDKDAPAGKMRFLDESNLAMATLVDFAWMDEDGAILSKVPNKDAYGATLSDYRQLICDDCRNQASLEDLA